MKKLILLLFVAVLAMTSCKKDRTCHCRTVTDYYDLTGTKTGTTTFERDEVYTKTTRKTAFYACVHAKTSQNHTNGNKAWEEDDYCELK